MPVPLSLPPQNWPSLDRSLWEHAYEQPGFLEAARPASAWSPKRRRIVEQAYGQWLSYLLRSGSLDLQARPEARVEPEVLEDFVAELQNRTASASVGMMMGALLRMMVVLAPEKDWGWLGVVAQRLKVDARPERNRFVHMVSPSQIYALGARLMDEAHHEMNRYKAHQKMLAATKGRDGLMLSLLVCCPMRMRNFYGLAIGDDFRFDAERTCYFITIDANQTKTARKLEAELPPQLTEQVDEYLTVWRPFLLARKPTEAQTRRLWISRFGSPLSESAVRDQIKRRTGEAFGRHVWPHLFRAIAATGVVDEAPEKIEVARDILGHSDIRTTERYYVLARGNRAHQEMSNALASARAEARARSGTSDTALMSSSRLRRQRSSNA